jgi:hypothetical protein
LILTGNPGGAGQHWIKKRYIDPKPSGMSILRRELPNGREHRYVFIPSRVENNEILLREDPDYINRLYLVGSPELVRAWLEGDWNAIEGAFFDNWSNKMLIKPFELPEDWMRFKSLDWGSAKPFSIGWWAVATDTMISPCGKKIRRGSLVRYREWYGATEPNVGLKMNAQDVGEGIADRSKDDPEIKYGVADPAAFTADGGPSIMERLWNREKEVLKTTPAWRRADNKRIARNGAMGGWDQMRQRIDENMIFCFNTCTDSIRTIPALQHDTNRPEDLDTEAEDHAADEWRYACMSRPMPAKIHRLDKRPATAQPTVSDLMQLHKTSKKKTRIRI